MKAAESLDQLSAELALKFPPSTRLVGVLRSPGGMDDAVRVKLELVSGELSSLLSQTHIEDESFSPGTGGMLGPDEEFWDPHQAEALRTGQTKRPRGRSLNVGVDEGKAGVAVVYIAEHGT